MQGPRSTLKSIARWTLLILAPVIGHAAQYGPKAEPAAMSMDYNPLRWQGDDAKFAFDMLYSSYCGAEISKVVAAKTTNASIQNLAFTEAHDQERFYRKLHEMARTLNVSLPRKRDLEACPATARLRELDGHELDSGYIAYLVKKSADDVARFEAEVKMPRLPSNWSLWAFAQKNLPVVREDASTIKNMQQVGPKE